MIRPTDAFTLAYTKLKTRKVRTIVTASVSSLMFGILVMAILVIAGVINSARDFTAGGLSDRYITSLTHFDSGAYYDYNNAEVRQRALEIHTQLVIDKTAEAKRLGIEYDPKSETHPVGDHGDGEKYLDETSLAAQKAIAEYVASGPSDYQQAKKIAAPYKPTAVYETIISSFSGQVNVVNGGKETFEADKDSYNPFEASPVSNGWVYMDGSVTKPFLLSDVQLQSQANSTAIPVIAPYDQIEKSLGLKPLAKTATREDQLRRIQQVRDKAHTVSYEVCYRNPVSMQLIEQAQQQTKEIAKNKNTANYQKPSLLYGLPDEPCGPVSVISDTRLSAEKDYENKFQQLESAFNPAAEPKQQTVVFRVVGVSPTGPSMNDFNTASMLVQTVAGTSLEGTWAVPSDLYSQLPEATKAQYQHFRETSGGLAYNGTQVSSMVGQLVEFETAEQAKKFMDDMDCMATGCANSPYVSYFGSNSALIDEIMNTTRQVLQVAGIVIAVIASIIMMGMVGRIAADSRRETAVFRAIGARRSDIDLVYIIYTLLFSIIIVLFSMAVGLIGATWVHSKLSNDATVYAQLTFAGAKEGEVFRFVGLWLEALVAVVGLVAVAGLASVVLPLIRNNRRSPLKDMRDDQ